MFIYKTILTILSFLLGFVTGWVWTFTVTFLGLMALDSFAAALEVTTRVGFLWAMFVPAALFGLLFVLIGLGDSGGGGGRRI